MDVTTWHQGDENQSFSLTNLPVYIFVEVQTGKGLSPEM